MHTGDQACSLGRRVSETPVNTGSCPDRKWSVSLWSGSSSSEKRDLGCDGNMPGSQTSKSWNEQRTTYWAAGRSLLGSDEWNQ